QIRVHMAYMNHPLLGDPVYGPKKMAFGIKTQMLHAKLIGFIHPRTGAYMEFESPLPDEFQRILNKLRQGSK
ncbi:MAG: RNA pseudouridine synthase, partial [Anaerovorax sp.]